ncbi:hypothetical protein CFK38_02860 [Brachybacterium vulturis]|uniref:Uncharacterized protein n=1 Tax=Brachybacterium vulturis TaxID=2017484 RepID=A0A291GK59_9MICO|nr:hypothetical protein [Brachybacterium vulturis]ATG50577.1 hypothetical protein CFK38_02860 [Brachybacterium vulturis]
MSVRSSDRPSSPPGKGRGSRFGSVLGIPVPVVLLALIASALMGVQLAAALEQTTASHVRAGSTAADSLGGTGKVSVGVPVVTETTLGTEVQRLIDSGTIQPMTSFDAATCLQEQGIPDSILIMEEVAWGGEQTAGWLLVHGPLDRETLRANGGIVSATVVLPTCGSTDDDLTPQQNRLWSGDVMIGSL